MSEPNIKRESKQQKALRSIRKAAKLATTELDDNDLVLLRLQYILKKVTDTWPNL